VTDDLTDPSKVARAFLRRDHVTQRRELLTASPFAAAEVDAAVAKLADAGFIVLTETYALDAVWWREQQRRAQKRIDAEHRANPGSSGPLLTELRAGLAPALAVPELFSALTAALAEAGYTRDGERIAHLSHRPTLPQHPRAACTRLQAIQLENPLEPPSRSALAPDPDGQAALKYLRDRGEVVELSPEIYLSRFVYARLRKAVTRYLETHGSATASQLRQALGTTRRVLIPLLEKLDRDGVTRREGNHRKLRSG
jgi:selenocysteine-specific elongation factor